MQPRYDPAPAALDAPRCVAPRKSLRGRLVGSFLTLSLVTVALVAVVAFYQSREALQRSKFDSLSSVALVKDGVLNRWVDEQRNALLLISELTPLSALVGRSQDPGTGQASRGGLSAEQSVSELQRFLGRAAAHADVTELFVLTPVGGEVIASTDPKRVGHYRVDDLFYQRGKLETFVQNVYASPVTSRPTLTIATPLLGSDGRTVGVLAANLNLASIDRLLADRAGLGQTGEAYLVSAFNDFVSAERFGRDAALRGVHSEGVSKALTGHNGTGLYENYDGVPVIGAYRWNKERELALLVEVGQAEAFAPARNLVTTILGFGLISALILTLGVHSLARQIAEPVVDLANAAQRVAEGDFNVTAIVSTDDEVGVLASAFNTMTHRLEELYRSLEEQIDARSRAMKELAIARDVAESATRAKSDFLARMSHEIRTPLNAVIGLAHLMVGTRLDETQRDYATKIQHSGQHLLGVINEILDFSRMEAKGMELEQTPFDLDELLERLPLSASDAPVEIVFQIRPDVPQRLLGDPFRLSQVLTNLLGNAMKFTRRGEVHLLVENNLDSGSDTEVELTFQVRDTGIGFEPSSAERLFESFSQADGSTTRRHGGSGLGLAICRQIVDLLGGMICAHGEPGVGSTFAFTARFQCVHDSAMTSRIHRELVGRRVLVYHPCETMRRATEECLASQGIAVVAAASADSLGLVVERHRSGEMRVDAILGDWSSLPMTMGSIGTLDVLREVPTVLLAAADERAVAHHGTSGWRRVLVVHKPLVRGSLLRTLRSLFSMRASLDPPASPGRDSRLQGERLLVVDDNAINQQIVCGLLGQAGAEASVASGGRQALEMIEGSRFDAIILDIRMPDMDGFELARAIRELSNSGPRLPLLALSADPLARDDERASRDIDVYLTKPIDPVRLIEEVAAQLSGGRESPLAPQPPGASAEPVLDVDAGLARAAGNQPLYFRLLETFVSGQSAISTELAALLEGEDPARAQARLHDLKGIGANLGAMRVAHIAESLLVKLRKNSAEAGLDVADRVELDAALAAVRKEVDSLLGRGGSLTRDVPAREPRLGRLGSLIQEKSS